MTRVCVSVCVSKTKVKVNSILCRRRSEPEPSRWAVLAPLSRLHTVLTPWFCSGGSVPVVLVLTQRMSADAESVVTAVRRMMEEQNRLFRAVRASESSGSRAESLKSDWSQDLPPVFSKEPVTTRVQGSSSETLKIDSLPWTSSRTSSRTSPWHPDSRLRDLLFGPVGVGRSSLLSVLEDTCLGRRTDSIRETHRRHLQVQCESVSEGLELGLKVPMKSVFSELFVSEVREDREVQLLETHYRKRRDPGPALRIHDLFRPSATHAPPPRALDPPPRLVLTVGVAGVGKTFSVQKFCLDWAQGSENQDLDLVVPLSFRELNLVSRERYSLLELLQLFHPALRPLPAHSLLHSRVLLVLDGLDESRLPLDFGCEVVSEVTQGSEVGVLLVNLIRGSLLPDARIWITSRPAAANQIPAGVVHRVTEVRGFFTDEQKETFFGRKFSDAEHLRTVLSHVRSSHSLQVMCQIPVFCWITATVLDHMLRRAETGPLPQTLTDLYVHFLSVQTQRKRKYHTESPEPTRDDCELLLKLGRLALKHLQRGNITFYSEDLEEVDLDPTEALVRSGLCSEVFRRESVMLDRAVYSFVHLSVQEFLGAVFLLHCFSRRNAEELRAFVGEWNERSALHLLLRKVLEMSLQSPTGHLDLFVRFLHGLCAPPHRRMLGALLGAQDYGKIVTKAVFYLRFMSTECIPPDRSVNIFHCLTEMNDLTFHHELQDFLRSRDSSRELSGICCSALGYALQMSEEVLEELNLRKFNCSDDGRRRLLPAVRNCRRAILCDLQLTSAHVAMVTSALSSSPSHLRVLDLSQNRLPDSNLDSLCAALQSPACTLETLSLRGCALTDVRPLLAALRSCSSLTELDLRGNSLQVCDRKELESAPRRLEIRMDPNLRCQDQKLRPVAPPPPCRSASTPWLCPVDSPPPSL